MVRHAVRRERVSRACFPDNREFGEQSTQKLFALAHSHGCSPRKSAIYPSNSRYSKQGIQGRITGKRGLFEQGIIAAVTPHAIGRRSSILSRLSLAYITVDDAYWPTAERRLPGDDCRKPDIDDATLGTTGFGPSADGQLLGDRTAKADIGLVASLRLYLGR